MRFPLRRILLGFAAGAAAGWVGSLLRRPADAPAGTGADAAEHMPQEEFGEPVADRPKPRKAVPPSITHPPGSDLSVEHGEHGEGGAEPAVPAKPAPRRAAKVATDPASVVTEAVRQGRAEVSERLAGLEDAATPPEAPKTRRRRTPPAE